MNLFSFIGPPPTEIYTLSLHDALPIFDRSREHLGLSDKAVISMRRYYLDLLQAFQRGEEPPGLVFEDRKSTRLNSSHVEISYAVFCLKKKTIRLISALGVTATT